MWIVIFFSHFNFHVHSKEEIAHKTRVGFLDGFRFNHIDVQFIVYVWIVFGLAKPKPGYVNILFADEETERKHLIQLCID